MVLDDFVENHFGLISTPCRWPFCLRQACYKYLMTVKSRGSCQASRGHLFLGTVINFDTFPSPYSVIILPL